jgi:prophage regulatory protein
MSNKKQDGNRSDQLKRGDGAQIEGQAPARLLSKPEVLDRVALTFPTIWKLMREGKFPHGRALGGKTVWVESEIEAWIAALPDRKYKAAETEAA